MDKTMTDMSSTNFSGALARVVAKAMAIPDPLLRPVNLDIPSAAVTVIGAMSALRALRPEIVNVLGERFAEPVDWLEVYAQAASQAHADYLSTSTAAGVQSLSDEVVAVREVLFTDATSLVKRKLIDGGELAELRGNVGFRNQIFDVLQLVGVFRRHWARIESTTPVTLADLDNAEALAKRFIDALGEREQGPAPTSERADIRIRVYSLLVNTYDEVRRVVTFLRWHQGDLESIAPSLWAGRGGRRSDEDTTPTPVVVAPVSPSTPSAPAAPPVAPGLPGNSPFAQ